MRPEPSATPDAIDLGRLLGRVRRALPRIVLGALIVGGSTFGILSLVAPRFTSEAELQVVGKGSANPFTDPSRPANSQDIITSRMDKEAINTHVRALLSADLAYRIVADEKLVDKVEFNSALGSVDALDGYLRTLGIGAPRAGESEQDRVLSSYFRRLEVYSPKESRLIGIRFTSTDPELAASIANRLAELYRETLASQTVVETDELQKALEPRIGKLVAEVGVAEAEVERFRGEANIFIGGPQKTGLNEQQLGELTAELTKASAARSESEARARSSRELMTSENAEALADVQKSPIIQNLVQQRVRAERQIAELSTTLMPGHPRMRQLAADLADLKRQIGQEVAKVVAGLEKEAKVAALREESIKKSLEEIKSRVVSTGSNEVKLRQLEAGAKSKRSELERLQAQYEANRARADSRVVPVEAQIVTKARATSVPTFPKRTSLAALAGAAFFLFGLSWSITRALFAGAREVPVAYVPRYQSEAAGQDGPARQPLAAVPPPEFGRYEPLLPHSVIPVEPAAAAASNTPASSGQPAQVADLSSLAELTAHLLARTVPGGGGYRTMIASGSDGIDASAEAIEIATTLSRQGKTVVLIDWDTKSGALAQALGAAPVPGLQELIAGQSSFQDAIRRLPGSSAHYIAAGAAPGSLAQRPEVSVSDQINLVLDALDEAYHHIIVMGRNGQARALFEIIEGRFDAGVTITEPKQRAAAVSDPPGTFLGFEVADISLWNYTRPSASAAEKRMLRGPAQTTLGAAAH